MRTASLGVLAVTCYSATAFILAPNARFVGTSVARTRAQRPVAASPLRMVEAGGGNENEKLNSLQAFSTELAKKFAVGAAIAAMAFAAPGDALAARSGGRMGGSSFSSPSVSSYRHRQSTFIGFPSETLWLGYKHVWVMSSSMYSSSELQALYYSTNSTDQLRVTLELYYSG